MMKADRGSLRGFLQAQPAMRIGLAYALVTGIWVSLANFILDSLLIDSSLHSRFEVVTDILQVVPTTLLIFYLLRRELAKRARVTAAHEASEHRLATILETAPDAVVGVNEEHRIFLFNRGAERIFGYPAQEVRDRPFEMLFPGNGDSGSRLDLDSLRGLPEPIYVVTGPQEVIARRKGGEEFPAEASLSKLTENGNVLFTVILEDISTRKAAEEHLRRSHQELEARVQERTGELHQERNRLARTLGELRRAYEELKLSSGELEAIARENARLYREAQKVAALEERQRLARELHDSVSQVLHGIALGTHAAVEMLERSPERVRETLDYVLGLAQAGVTEMRCLIFDLRPDSIESEGLISAFQRLAEATKARYDISVKLDIGTEPDLGVGAKEALYRICQEAFWNMAKHSHARNGALRFSVQDSETILEVSDDGIGFDAAGLFPGHMGLQTMRERAGQMGASFSIDSAPGCGTRVTVRIPVVPDPEGSSQSQPSAERAALNK